MRLVRLTAIAGSVVVGSLCAGCLHSSSGSVPIELFLARSDTGLEIGFTDDHCVPQNFELQLDRLSLGSGDNTIWEIVATSDSASTAGVVELGAVPPGYREEARDDDAIRRITEGTFAGVLGAREELRSGRVVSGSVALGAATKIEPGEALWDGEVVDRSAVICP